MQKPIENPQVPYVGPIPGGIHPGKMVRIQGVAAPNGDRFDINIQCGPNRDDIGLHISVRLNQGYIARNSYQQMSGWGEEQGDGPLLIGHGQQFEVLILSDLHDYKIAVNGQHFCMFPYRVPKEHLSHLLINGDVLITLISWEGNVPLQQSGGPPPMGSPSAPPMMPPVSKGPPGYGVPTPPGGHDKDSFNSFLDQAQNALMGAVASGAANRLLGGFLQNRSGGYTPQNAQYGRYPQMPAGSLGSVGSILLSSLAGGGGHDRQHTGGGDIFGGLLSSLSNRQQQNYTGGPTAPPMNSPGGGADGGMFEGILSSLAGGSNANRTAPPQQSAGGNLGGFLGSLAGDLLRSKPDDRGHQQNRQ